MGRMEGTREEWKLVKERKEARWLCEGRWWGGCKGGEISVSAKVFIKILRQMISVSFS